MSVYGMSLRIDIPPSTITYTRMRKEFINETQRDI